MSNHPREFPTGAPVNSELTSAAISNIDIRVAKSPNGDEGSDHVGSCTFGGLRAEHMTNTPGEISTAASATPTATLDFDVASNFFVIVTAFAGDQSLALTVDNFRVGDRGTLMIQKMNGATRNLTLTMAGAVGFIASFEEGDGFVDDDAAAEAITVFALETFEHPTDGPTLTASNRGTLRTL